LQTFIDKPQLNVLHKHSSASSVTLQVPIYALKIRINIGRIPEIAKVIGWCGRAVSMV